jgi:hypothetical protein
MIKKPRFLMRGNMRDTTLGNNGKIYRSLRWQQELPEQKLMRVRFERFGLSVLLETNSSLLSPDANESARTH